MTICDYCGRNKAQRRWSSWLGRKYKLPMRMPTCEDCARKEAALLRQLRFKIRAARFN